MSYGYGWWHGWGMGVGWLLFLLLIAGAIWFAARATRGRDGVSPEEILRRRYAGGEISEQEYRQRLGVLHGTPGDT